MDGRQANSFMNESEVYGTDDDQEIVVRFLTEMDDERGLSIYSWYGRPGEDCTCTIRL